LVVVFHSDRVKDLENVLLRQEMGIYRRGQKKPKLKPVDRILTSIVQVITGYSFGFRGFQQMNAITELLVRSVRRECLDWLIIVGEQQKKKLLEEYVYYYNEQRPHQGIG